MNKLTYERAKLLYTPYDVDQMRHLCALRDVEIDRLRADSAKLRELVRELWTYAEQDLLCDENCSYGAVCDWRDCVFKRRMRETGIEVDE